MTLTFDLFIGFASYISTGVLHRTMYVHHTCSQCRLPVDVDEMLNWTDVAALSTSSLERRWILSNSGVDFTALKRFSPEKTKSPSVSVVTLSHSSVIIRSIYLHNSQHQQLNQNLCSPINLDLEGGGRNRENVDNVSPMFFFARNFDTSLPIVLTVQETNFARNK